MRERRISKHAFNIFQSWPPEAQEKYLELPAYDTMSREMLSYPFRELYTPEEGIKLYMYKVESDLIDHTTEQMDIREDFEYINKLKFYNRSVHQEFEQRTLGILDNDIREYLRLQDIFEQEFHTWGLSGNPQGK